MRGYAVLFFSQCFDKIWRPKSFPHSWEEPGGSKELREVQITLFRTELLLYISLIHRNSVVYYKLRIIYNCVQYISL